MPVIAQEDYAEFTKAYEQAMEIICIKLNAFSDDYEKNHYIHPIHHIQQRIKSKESMEGKLQMRELPVSLESAGNELTDIAGIRVICYFIDEVYEIVKCMKKYKDIEIIKEADYISEPKENGYQSYHLIVGCQILHDNEVSYYPVEIQIRTLGMDFWASMEHRLCYKRQLGKDETIADYFKSLSDNIYHIEEELRGKETEGLARNAQRMQNT